MSANQKFASLQILRALAAWTVVFHHFMQWYFGFRASTPVGTFFSEYGFMGVDVFFVISGFVVFLMAEKSSAGPAGFLVNRFFRIVPIYWTYVLIVIVCIRVFPRGFDYTGYDLRSLIETVTFLPSWNPTGLGYFPVLVVGWTLNFEVFFYISLAFCMLLSRKHFLSILACTFVVLPLAYPKNIFYSEVAGSAHLWEFLLGAAIAVAWRNPKLSSFVTRCTGLALTGVAVLLLLSIGTLPKFRGTVSVAGLVVVLALLLDRYISSEAAIIRWLVKLGDESYSTYLVHGIVLGVFINSTGKDISQVEEFAILLGYILGVHMLSALSYRYLERSSSLSAVQRWVMSRVASKKDLRSDPVGPAAP